jgi:hypothetical protein
MPLTLIRGVIDCNKSLLWSGEIANLNKLLIYCDLEQHCCNCGRIKAVFAFKEKFSFQVSITALHSFRAIQISEVSSRKDKNIRKTS